MLSGGDDGSPERAQRRTKGVEVLADTDQEMVHRGNGAGKYLLTERGVSHVYDAMRFEALTAISLHFPAAGADAEEATRSPHHLPTPSQLHHLPLPFPRPLGLATRSAANPNPPLSPFGPFGALVAPSAFLSAAVATLSGTSDRLLLLDELAAPPGVPVPLPVLLRVLLPPLLPLVGVLPLGVFCVRSEVPDETADPAPRQSASKPGSRSGSGGSP